jgi:hypothetical protein
MSKQTPIQRAKEIHDEVVLILSGLIEERYKFDGSYSGYSAPDTISPWPTMKDYYLSTKTNQEKIKGIKEYMNRYTEEGIARDMEWMAVCMMLKCRKP